MSDNCVYVDVAGVLRRWNGARWEGIKALSAVAQATMTTPSGYGCQAGSMTLQRIGESVLFSGGEIGPTASKKFNGGGLYELGAIIPAGFRSRNEVKIPCTFMNGWGSQTLGLMGLRPNGSVFLIPSATVTMPKYDTWHTIVLPPATWPMGG